jgi:hypothetical protein
MIACLRAARQLRCLLRFPRNTFNRYYFSTKDPNDDVPSPVPPSEINKSQHIPQGNSKAEEKKTGPTNKAKTKSKQLKSLSEIAQKAILASAAINHIINSKPPKTVQRSVRD